MEKNSLAGMLQEAVEQNDAETAISLLESVQAGQGSCAVHDLVKHTSEASRYNSPVKFSIVVDGPKETIMLYEAYHNQAIPVAGITQQRCKR